MLRVLVIALVLLVGAMMWFSGGTRVRPDLEVATVFASSRPLPELRLIDHRGVAFSSDRLAGQFSLLFFGFTHCPDICPITLKVLADANAELAHRGLQPPDVIFVSVDPQRDTPEQIERYLNGFDPAFLGVTGDPQALESLTKFLGVMVQTHAGEGEAAYSITHNASVFLIGPQTELIAVFGPPHQASTIAADYLKIRQRYPGDHPDRSVSL